MDLFQAGSRSLLYVIYSGGASDAFLLPLAHAGSALHCSSFLGGSEDDYGQGVRVAAPGPATIAGFTDSTDLPTAGPLWARGAEQEAFMARIDTRGNDPHSRAQHTASICPSWPAPATAFAPSTL